MTTQKDGRRLAEATLAGGRGASDDGERQRLVETRRDLHRHPELSGGERRTAGIVERRLAATGLTVQTGIGGTGVVGEVRGVSAGPTVLLRADMDALPIQEEIGREYASAIPGVMHACGHDGHVAVLLAVAERLAATRNRWPGAVRCLFQPAEETAEGARAAIEAGVIDGVDAALALHLWAPLPAGTVGVLPGPLMAGSSDFRITVRGQGGHAAEPHRAVDPVVAAAEIVLALQTLVSRETAPADAAVVTVGRLQAGSARNAIPETATLEGTLRAFDPAVLDRLEGGIERVAVGIARALGAAAAVEIIPDTVPTVSDPGVAALVHEAAAEVLGPQAVRSDPTLRTMAAEDFGFILERVPGAFFLMGAGPADGSPAHPHHSPHFDLCEEALPMAVEVMEAAALRLLGRESVGG